VKYVVQFDTFSGFRLSFQVQCFELAAFCELNDSFPAWLSHHRNLGAMYKSSQRFLSNVSHCGHHNLALKCCGSFRPSLLESRTLPGERRFRQGPPTPRIDSLNNASIGRNRSLSAFALERRNLRLQLLHFSL
jgi:hypothetical protein